MDERELNEMRMKIALMLGRKFERGFKDKAKVFMLDPDETVLPGYEMQPGDVVRWAHGDPDWPRDIKAAWELESEVESAGRILGPEQSRYVRHLLRVLGIEYRRDGEDNVLTCDEDLWAITHATPEQKCRAYLAWKQEAQP
jgi:hypothetical protein